MVTQRRRVRAHGGALGRAAAVQRRDDRLQRARCDRGGGRAARARGPAGRAVDARLGRPAPGRHRLAAARSRDLRALPRRARRALRAAGVALGRAARAAARPDPRLAGLERAEHHALLVPAAVREVLRAAAARCARGAARSRSRRDRRARRASERELEGAALDLQGRRARPLRRRRPASVHAQAVRRAAADPLRAPRDAQARRRRDAGLGHRAVVARGEGQGPAAGRLRGQRGGPGTAVAHGPGAARRPRASGGGSRACSGTRGSRPRPGRARSTGRACAGCATGAAVDAPALAAFRRSARRLEGCAKATDARRCA